MDESRLDALAGGLLPVVEDFDEDFCLEMQGIAAGADALFSHTVPLNAWTELLKRPARLLRV